ncbi:putative tryptophanyl-tRNA synthetase [Talaromyces proteolyticus]|uniref:Small ribosomal subunit protein uS10m n=1 Tax=Talaromyces proteolyticus TaxID=1131652 RepID=A0AAD4PUT2_9EURO|nr:putative tryptophanyl-tRNA synthetase [Talaromyces proteolyticus]KAH8689715.1 putative tryptophanyl-tRNA synthetase [Talaromyces proteolyticus]
MTSIGKNTRTPYLTTVDLTVYTNNHNSRRTNSAQRCPRRTDKDTNKLPGESPRTKYSVSSRFFLPAEEPVEETEKDRVKSWPQRLDDAGQKFRLPRSVQALYLRPLRRKAQYGLPVCDLQLRSYSVRNVDFFADFAIRSAYYLKLPVSGPVPLPRIVERWTVPRSNFVHKKSQENFERITLRRLIQIKDGNPETVQLWLAFLRKHAFYGVGMKANVWDFDDLDVAGGLDAAAEDVNKTLEPYFAQFGQRENSKENLPVESLLNSERFLNLRSPLNEVPPSRKVVFSGIQPTGIPHLGNYLGALREWVRLQNESSENSTLLFSVVDLHALTVPQEASQLRQWRREIFAMLLAIGLDYKRSAIFFQSAVPAHTELMWILSTVASMGYLSRMTQWKSKLQLPDDVSLDDSDAKSKLRLGLFSYPVLQAADILVHRATHVPVGEDQKQHIEFTRHTANSFNHLFGSIFPAPESLISPARRVMSLKNPSRKMSKSDVDDRSRILLTDSRELIEKKIKMALTDSEPSITYDPSGRPGISNLIEILSHFDSNGKTCEELALELKSTHISSLKSLVVSTVDTHLQEIRDSYREIINQKTAYLDSVAEEGAQQARANASVTMEAVRSALGL